MYLLPTSKEMNELWRQVDPKQRFLDSAAMAINELTKNAMPYFDEIEDDIINMRRDVNGFKLHIPAPRYLDKPNPGDCPVNFKGWTFEVKEQPADLGERVRWDDI
jgi:hypothetical protein